ncbi:hypothetical protein ACROYT_G011343 [Oculina patagonica]
MYIPKELWTNEVEKPKVKNSYQYVFELREKLEDTLDLAHSDLQKCQQKDDWLYEFLKMPPHPYVGGASRSPSRAIQATATIRDDSQTEQVHFGVDSVQFLGHQLQCGLVGLHEDNVANIRDAPKSSTKKQIRSFMGLAGYYRDFIPNFAAVVAPLSDLTRKGQPNRGEWGDAQERVYQSVKVHLTSTPILRLPDPSKTYYLRTDASDNGIGAVLIQEHEGKLFPVCYASKKLSNVERNYSTIEKECLAIVWEIERFHLYLYGERFVLQIDHEPLKYMNSAKFMNSRR